MRDPYEILGLSRSASEQEIKRAYRKLAKENHPDRHGGDKKAQAKFAEINAAYEILGDKDKRAQFDRGEIDAEGKPRFQGFAGGGGGSQGFENVDPSVFADAFSSFGFGGRRAGRTRTFRFSRGRGAEQTTGEMDEDVLSAILNGLGGETARGARPAGAPARGADVRAEVAVTLEDVAAEKKPKVALPTGKTLSLTLPRGVTDGQVIRLKGQGLPGPIGGEAGDALVTVRFVPHPLFRAEGADLRVDVPIGLDEAVLGAKVPVPTLTGRVQVTVPPGSSGGRALRLKGKGLPAADGGQGDLLATLQIALPETPEPELEALMRKWREEGRPSPRGKAFG
jgi:DnaJ-class molecular chaperone